MPGDPTQEDRPKPPPSLVAMAFLVILGLLIINVDLGYSDGSGRFAHLEPLMAVIASPIVFIGPSFAILMAVFRRRPWALHVVETIGTFAIFFAILIVPAIAVGAWPRGAFGAKHIAFLQHLLLDVGCSCVFVVFSWMLRRWDARLKANRHLTSVDSEMLDDDITH